MVPAFNRMKIAINIDGQFGAMTGVQFYVDSLLDALYRLETPHRVCAFMPSVWSPTLWRDAARGGGFAWLDSPRSQVDTAGSDWFLGSLPAVRRLAERSRTRRAAQVLDRRIVHPAKAHLPGLTERRARAAARRYDVLHTPGTARVESLLYRARRNVVTLYDTTALTHPETHTPANVAMSEFFFDYARRYADRVITISEFSKADLVGHLGFPGDRVDVIPLAARAGTRRVIDSAEALPTLAKFGLADGPFVLYSGTLEERKNLKRLVRAFARVLPEAGLPGLTLALAGGSRGGHGEELRLLAEELGVGTRVIQTGYVSGDEMNVLMSCCALFAYVSEYEGFGLPPLEAMTCGAPVLASRTTSLPEVRGEAGLLVEPTDIDGMGAALLRLLTDAAENARQRALSLQRAREFSWAQTARRTLRTYEAAAA